MGLLGLLILFLVRGTLLLLPLIKVIVELISVRCANHEQLLNATQIKRVLWDAKHEQKEAEEGSEA